MGPHRNPFSEDVFCHSEKKIVQGVLYLPGPTGSQRSIRPPAPGSDARAGLHLEEVLQDTRPPQDQALRCPPVQTPVYGLKLIMSFEFFFNII